MVRLAYCVSVTGAPRKPLPPLALSRVDIDRAGWNRSRADLLADPAAQVIDLRGGLLRLDGGGLATRAPEPEDGDALVLYLGEATDGTQHLAVLREAPDEQLDDYANLRTAVAHLAPEQLGIATTAVAMAEWHATTRFCRRCGKPLAPHSGGWLLRCEDGHESYPQTSPAVIMSVVDDDDRLLLANGSRWGEKNRSVLAGFVEPGESLESAVAREVREEVGLVVDQVEYQGNQPWPFPASLMIAYSCRATSTAMTLDPEEITAAEWYTREELAEVAQRGDISLPGPISVAYHLIAQWYGGPPPGARTF